MNKQIADIDPIEIDFDGVIDDNPKPEPAAAADPAPADPDRKSVV